MLEDYTKAVAAFQRSLELEPTNHVIHYKLADIYLKTEQLDKAITNIELAIDADKSNKYYYLLAVEIYSQANELEKVVEVYTNLIENFPNGNQYLFNLANVYTFQQNLDLALDTYNRIEDTYGINDQTTFQKQKIYLQKNDVEKAIEEGEKLINAFPEIHQYTIMLCEILASNNRQQEAIERLQKLTDEEDNLGEAHLLLADIYWKQRKLDEFEAEFQQACADPELNVNAKIQNIMRYMAYVPNAQLEPIILKIISTVKSVHKEDANVQLLSGDIYATFLEKELIGTEEADQIRKKAIDSYTFYIEYDPSKFAVWQNLLNLELQSENQDSLRSHADQALELFPNQAWLYLVSGVAMLQDDEPESAVQMFEMGKRRSVNNPGMKILFNGYLGDTYYSLDNYAESDAAYEEALEMDPNNYIVLNNYSYYLSLRGENLDKAFSMSTQLIRNNPDNNTYLDTYAWVNYALGKYDEAKRVLEKIIASGEENAEYHNHYGDVLFQLGQQEKAIEQWKKARELDSKIENIDQKIREGRVVQ